MSDETLIYDRGELIGIDLFKCAQDLINRHKILTVIPGREMLRYQNGVYTENAREVIRLELECRYGDLRVGRRFLLNSKIKDEIIDKVESLSFINQYRQISPVRIPTFDADLDIINMSNGLYNWRTGEFRSHRPDYLSRIQIPIEYNPDAESVVLNEIIDDVLDPEDRIKFKEFIAYCFYRSYKIQKSMIFFGPAGSGKSVLIKILQNMLGIENCTSVSLQDLGGRHFDKFAIAKLYNKLLNVAGDMDDTAIPEVGKFKMLTSGSDLISARKPYGQPFEFINFAKILLSANSLPPVNDKSDGFYRRVEIIEFKNKFSINSDKSHRLSSLDDPKELSGLFNECIKLLPDLLNHGDFSYSNCTKTVREFYYRASNTIETFVDECVQPGEGYITKEELYQAYLRYCELYNLPSIENKIAFGREIKRIAGLTDTQRRIGDQRYWCYVGLKVVVGDEVFSM